MTAISSLMTRRPLVTIGLDAWVSDAAKTLADAGVSHLLVTGEGDKLLGVFCVCDLDRAETGTKLRQHMHAEPITVDLHAEAEDALALMESRHVSCLPVVEQGRLSGVITLHDLRRIGLASGEAERCSACGSTEHVRCTHGRTLGLCIDCARKSEPADGDAELGGGD